MIIETARLVLRPVAPDDYAQLHALFTQPGVRRFIFDNQVIPPEQTKEIISRSQESFARERFGLWLAEARPPGQPVSVGFGALWYFRDPPERELLYGVDDDHVRHGYGREIALAIVGYGFDGLHMLEIRASTDAAHVHSRRLLDSLGFTFERQSVVEGIDTAFYALRRK